MFKKYAKILVLPVLLSFIVFACKKDGGAYSYETPVDSYNGSVYEYIKSQKGVLDSFALVIDRLPGNLKDTLQNLSARYTVFLPTNASFSLALDNLNRERSIYGREPLNLSTYDSSQLDTLVRRYVIAGTYTTDTLSSLLDGMNLPSLAVDTTNLSDNTIDHHYLMQGSALRTTAEGVINGGELYIMFSDRKNSIFKRYWITTSTHSVNGKAKNALMNVLKSGHEFGFNEFTNRGLTQ
ncbi:fasciclin domain-containing protein [Chitinophagaceae bacterium 26-R-25]|nr:fasciclin domain-containing protein [Chitinophagaceae bacterium 26-R-25]